MLPNLQMMNSIIVKLYFSSLDTSVLSSKLTQVSVFCSVMRMVYLQERLEGIGGRGSVIGNGSGTFIVAIAEPFHQP